MKSISSGLHCGFATRTTTRFKCTPDTKNSSFRLLNKIGCQRDNTRKRANFMVKPTHLKKLVEQLCDLLPSHVSTLKKDFEKNCQRIIPAFLDKLDLVTREEFDTQSKVLARTRKKLEQLEKQIEHLEHLLKNKKK